jgi:hypothetical protein
MCKDFVRVVDGLTNARQQTTESFFGNSEGRWRCRRLLTLLFKAATSG